MATHINRRGLGGCCLVIHGENIVVVQRHGHVGYHLPREPLVTVRIGQAENQVVVFYTPRPDALFQIKFILFLAGYIVLNTLQAFAFYIDVIITLVYT